MKHLYTHILASLFLLTAAGVQAQCHAGFTWEQIPGTLQIHFQNTSTSENDIISNQWNFGDGHEGDGVHPTHTYAEAGTYLVCLTIHDSEGCASDVCHEVTVQPLESGCEANFTWEQIPGTLQIHFNSTSTSSNDIIYYSWNFGDGHEGDGNDPYHTYEEAGGYLVCLVIIDTDSCVSDVCYEVHVGEPEDPCHADFTWDLIPGSLGVHFFSQSTSEHDIILYHWTFGDGHDSDDQNPGHEYDEPGTYLVCLRIEDNTGCVSEICHEVTIGQEEGCHAQFTWEQIPGTLQIHFNSTSTSEHDIISYSWNFGDGHEGDGNDPYHTYEESGVYVVCLYIEDSEGCTSHFCHEVTVQPLESGCHAQFTWEQIPGTQQIHFNSTSTSSSDIIYYGWNFGDGHFGDGNDPYHTYEEAGGYLVCLVIIDADSCVSDVCHEVHVGEPEGPCHAAFTWDFIPGSLGVHFYSQSTSEHEIISYHWTFGDGHSSDGQNPGHEYEEPGTYLVCLRIEDNTGCVSEICHEVIIGHEEGCHANFTWEQIPGTQQIHFNSTSTSSNDIIYYGWNFGDGHVGDGNDPYHTYEEAGGYLVCLVIIDTDSCVSDVCYEVHVGEPEGNCHAAFTWDFIPGSLGVHFFSQSTSEHEIISYHWTFGDGHSSDGQNPGHEYDEPGTYLVCLRIEDNTGCVSEICHEVTIGQEEGCHAQFTWEQIPGTLQIHFNSTSTSENDIVFYSWNFGDGHEGDGNDPYHTYEESGVYVVCLYIEDSEGCTSHYCYEVTVQPLEEGCHAQFTWEQIPGTQQIHFNSTSTSSSDIIYYGWNFGDGHVGDGNDPYHTYEEAGGYLVCLVIIDADSCVSDVCHEVHVGEPEIEPCHASFNYDIDEDGVVFFYNHSTGTTEHTTWLWVFDDGHTSDIENPHHTFNEPGVYTVCLYIADTTTECVDSFCLEIFYELEVEDLQFEIFQYTNPVSAAVEVDYYLDTQADVQFDLYDLTGHRLVSLIDPLQNVGYHERQIDLSRFPSGMYILSMLSGVERRTMRVTLVR